MDSAAYPDTETNPKEKPDGPHHANDRLQALGRPRLDTLRLAASTILDLAEDDLLSDPLEADLYLFRDRIDAALGRPEEQHRTTP